MKNRFLTKLDLIKFAVFNTGITKDDFLIILDKIVGNSEEINIFRKPQFIYFGEYDYWNFKITENPRIFKNSNCATIYGKITYQKEGIKLDIESYLFDVREFIFLLVGIIMFLIGLFNLISSHNIQAENVFVPLVIGFFITIITYRYIKKKPNLAIKNFEKRIKSETTKIKRTVT